MNELERIKQERERNKQQEQSRREQHDELSQAGALASEEAHSTLRGSVLDFALEIGQQLDLTARLVTPDDPFKGVLVISSETKAIVLTCSVLNAQVTIMRHAYQLGNGTWRTSQNTRSRDIPYRELQRLESADQLAEVLATELRWL